MRNSNVVDDIAPAERRRLQQEMIQAQRAEEERLMEERIRLEQEKDPDALEEDIRKQVLMERQTRRGIMDQTLNTTQAVKR